eukprot:scaffold44184_cov57-Phaeocystis_antarctica.AAC.2
MAAAQSPLGRGVLGRGVNREPFWFLAAADSPCQGNCDASFHDLHCQPSPGWLSNLRCASLSCATTLTCATPATPATQQGCY